MKDQKDSVVNLRIYQISLCILLLLGVFFRFYDLSSRPVHHDESLHGTYARYAVENPEQSFYHYNPMLHGPLLYQCTAWLFSIFGVSTFSLRLLNAILGSLFLLTPLLFRRFVSPSAVIWSTAALALSPGLIYWSRFAHHDYLVLASYTLLAAGILITQARVGIIFCLISFALQYSIKANIFVFAALLVGYLVFDLLCAVLLKKQKSWAATIWGNLVSNKAAAAIGAFLAAIIFSALYSGNFRDSTGIRDGLYRKVFAYWIEQHHIQRLDGPFSFHLLVLFLYELPLLIAFIAALILAILQLKKGHRILLAIVSTIFLLTPFFLPSELYSGGALSVYLKVKSPFDLFVNLELAILAIVLPLNFILRNQRALSFFSYLAIATLWTYSFLGEKVPWLTIYPQVSALIFVILFFEQQKFFERDTLSLVRPQSLTRFAIILSSIVISVITICIVEALLKGDTGAISSNTLRLLGWSFGCLVTSTAFQYLKLDAKFPALSFGIFAAVSIYTSTLTNFTLAGDEKELLSQVHTTEKAHQLFLSLRSYLANPLDKSDPKILVSGSSVWPATWYFRNLPGYSFNAEKSNYSNFNYLVVDETDDGVNENFDSEQIPLQSWWVPDYSKLRLKTLLFYYFNHEPWSPTGALQVKFAVPLKENTEEELQSDSEESAAEEELDESEAEDPNADGDEVEENEPELTEGTN